MASIQDLIAVSNVYLKQMADGKRCIGYEQLGYDQSGAVGFASIPPGASSAEITFEDAGAADSTLVCRYTIDGVTTPTTSLGTPAGKADTVEISHPDNIINFQVISIDAITQKLNVIYYE